MIRTSFAFAVIAALLAASPARAVDGVYNTGRSDTETDETGTLDVRFGPCAHDAAKVCGTIAAVHEPDGPSGRTHMPDGSPILGFEMIRDLKPEGDGRYRDGRINAVDESLRKGKMIWYGVKIDDLGAEGLKVTGCLGFICPRTMRWSMVGAGPEAYGGSD